MYFPNGFELNLIWATFCSFSVFVVFVGYFVNFKEAFLPHLISGSFRYGKAAESHHRKASTLLPKVPKSWFAHFYVWALVVNGPLWLCAFRLYILGNPMQESALKWLDFVSTSKRIHATSSEATFLVLTLFMIHVLRRLYECIHVHKSGAKMNVLHYLLGFVHYGLIGSAVLSEAPGFCAKTAQLHRHGKIEWISFEADFKRNFTYAQIAAFILFLWASKHQMACNRILADLRKHEDDNRGYFVPRGDWFEYVSCPHYLAEILIYCSFCVALGVGHQTGQLLLIWVAANQIISALMSHFWYQDKFDDYPSKRRAIIPYLL